MIQLDSKCGKPIYEQIIEQIKLDIMKGYLQRGDTIPSVRKLALNLSITPTTVSKAYQELERQGIIETIIGKGTFIASDLAFKVDEQKLNGLEEKLFQQILGFKMMGVTKEEIIKRVHTMYDSIGQGESHVYSK